MYQDKHIFYYSEYDRDSSYYDGKTDYRMAQS